MQKRKYVRKTPAIKKTPKSKQTSDVVDISAHINTPVAPNIPNIIAPIIPQPSSKCTLIYDTRERAVTEKHAIELVNTTRICRQLLTADYAIMSPDGHMMIIFERKSLEDFAASFKDGRDQNRQNLIEMREKTGCRIAYIVEGPEYPSPDERFAGIPYKYIESSIFHMMVRDNITIMRTRDTLHTCQSLVAFTRSMDSLLAGYDFESIKHSDLPALLGGNDGNSNETPTINKPEYDAMALLLAPHTKSDQDIVRELWACFRGITVTSADNYITLWSLADIICCPARTTITSQRIAGRPMPKNIIQSLTGINKATETKILSAIPSISAVTAGQLTDQFSLVKLVTMPRADLESINVGKAGKPLGTARAQKIIHYLNFTTRKDIITEEITLAIAQNNIPEITL